jgi:hypothetical protein
VRVLSYGEDPLTYWALSQRMAEFLEQLNDDSDLDEVLFLYRPSFGRAAGAQFGEFDAIVGTPVATYLVEAKWHGSGEVSTGTVILRPEQYRRHEIFAWYRNAWERGGNVRWTDFLGVAGEAWLAAYPDRKLAPEGSLLARNLEFVLTQLADCGPAQDVVLFVGLKGLPAPTAVESERFQLVVLEYEGLDGSGYFNLPTAQSGE